MFTIYDIATGRIIRTVTCPVEDLPSQVPDGASATAGEYDDETFYFDGDEMVERPKIALPQSFTATIDDTVTISDNLPAETFVAMNGVHQGVANEGALQVVVSAPGTLLFRLTPPFPWQVAITKVYIE